MTRTRPVDRRHHSEYLAKAEEFHSAMLFSEQSRKSSAAVLNAVHCVIACFDALTVFYLGMRSASQKHEDVTQLVRRIPVDGVTEKIRQFSDILRLKHMVEYDFRSPRPDEASLAVRQATRVFSWASALLKAV